MRVSDVVWKIALMAALTYLCRAVTLVLARKKITNVRILSFFEYLPYGVLSAMVFPVVFYSSASLVSALVGTFVAGVLSFFKRGLLTVALSATSAVFVTELIMSLVCPVFSDFSKQAHRKTEDK